VNPQTQPVQPQEFVHVDNPYQAPVQQSVQYCEFCGQQLKPGVKFCASCGTKVEVPFGE
ncbi:MAG: zinc-ribbon domain-containing protein, partial [Clostridiales bacterium]|nr:zinc-ribbon domain-containing protein [Clostridiales bacterium]